MRNIRKVYRIACIMIGKRKVHAIILGCIAAVLFAAYQNHFNLQMTVQVITDGLSEICTKIH